MSQPDFWSDRAQAETAARQASELKDDIAIWERLNREADELSHLVREQDAESIRADLEQQLTGLESAMTDLEFRILLAGDYDDRNAIVAIHAGTGGTDAQDWAGMLLRMYLRYCERQGWRTRVLDESPGQEAGVKSVTFEVSGRFAYGYLKNEAGVHRLVRISPFDAEKMRHTSFALIEALPELDAVEQVEIDPKDLRIDTFLSSGHGGQSVQTTYSAVRIVHLPTKITVSVQNERSQTQNKETALKILKAKLHQLALNEQQAEKEKLRGEFHEAAWGNQIRSYVLQPYRMVKDHRTDYETADVDRVLDGSLNEFVEANLRRLATPVKAS